VSQLYREPSRSLFKQPIRSWRAPGVKGICAVAPRNDPAFDVAGLPNPFTVYFPVFVTNLYTATIYITSLLVSPPGGWTDSEQNVTTVGVGLNAKLEKSNATRAVPATPANETITVRYNYRTGSYAGPIVGFDDFQHAIYWENITTGTVEDTDDFEDPPNPGPPQTFDGWEWITDVGTAPTRDRQTDRVVHGAYSLRTQGALMFEGYWSKSHTFAAGNRAYIFGFVLNTPAGHVRITIEGPVEELEIVYMPNATWRRFGIRLNPGEDNAVLIHIRKIWGIGTYTSVYLDYLRWVRY